MGVNDEVPGTCSPKPSDKKVTPLCPDTCTSTNEVTSSTSKVTVPSNEVCPTKSTTVKPVESTTSLPTPSVLSSTNEFEVTPSPSELTCESTTSSTLNLDCLSSNESTKTKLSERLTRKLVFLLL